MTDLGPVVEREFGRAWIVWGFLQYLGSDEFRSVIQMAVWVESEQGGGPKNFRRAVSRELERLASSNGWKIRNRKGLPRRRFNPERSIEQIFEQGKDIGEDRTVVNPNYETARSEWLSPEELNEQEER